MSRPISTGTGVRLSVYVPRDLWERFDGVVQRMFADPVVSRCVQDALLMYVEDLEAKEQQGKEIDKMGGIF